MTLHAAITIVSKNYFAFAQVLAESYKRQHPDHDFIVVLVDRADGMVPARLTCGAEVVEIAAFDVPDLERMIYRYSIMELNTAVKPFVLAHLFRHHAYDTLVYLDPDIWVFEPLAEVYAALGRAAIVLTPHMRRPFYDDASPSETAIVQSGTYNLGFVGLRRGPSAERLLQWWMGKLYRDCVVDIANGLFVDQKWIDLVPGFFPDHAIVYHPGYNAAYWNLHERVIARSGAGWMADGRPLVFFHFSGYVPFAPDTLSKHQNRHRLADLPDLKALTDEYAGALVARGYEESCRWPYAFATLRNGVKLPLDLVAPVMQWASRQNVTTPCPVTQPEAFCRFLMSRGTIPERPGSVLLFDFLLRARPDVRDAFPAAVAESDDAGFRAWIAASGTQEYILEDLLPFEQRAAPLDMVADAFDRLRLAAADGAPDIASALASGARGLATLVDWIRGESRGAHGLTPAHADAIEAAQIGIGRVLHLYFLRGDLQRQFPDLSSAAVLEAFVAWLVAQRHALDVPMEQVSAFREFALANGELLARAAFLYLHRGRDSRVEPSIYAVESRRNEIASPLAAGDIARWLASEAAIEPIDHYRMCFGSDGAELHDFAAVSVPELDAQTNFTFVKRLRAQGATVAGASPRINVAGYFTAATGMGESGRSLRACARAAGFAAREVTLAHAHSALHGVPDAAALFGWPQAGADVSIVVANADATADAKRLLPRSFDGRRRIGYWVWESERLPPALGSAQSRYDEIWAPSRYAAEAIARTVSLPVRVLAHTLDFEAIARAAPDRTRFGLPADRVVYGFVFDPRSVLERKNVRALVRAFEAAFRADDRCVLVLKVNANGPAGYEFDSILAEVRSDRVVVIDGVLDRDATFAFLKSLDIYVSLHRAEGFGLTCAEAMACGVPVVASGYSGNLDFMDDDNSLLVPTAVVETDRPYGPYPAGTRWGDPDHDAAVAALRVLHGVDARRRLAAAGPPAVARLLATDVVAARLRALVADAAAGRSAAAQVVAA